MKDVMVDLETIGQGTRAAIATIAAVGFGRTVSRRTFYCRVDIESCVKAGLELDADTVLWWLRQDGRAARELWQKPRLPLSVALDRLAAFLKEPDVRVWGNGAGFDNAILASAYRAIGRPLPWKFYNDRCYRTMKGMHPEVKLHRSGTHHNALADAISQARHLVRILKGAQA